MTKIAIVPVRFQNSYLHEGHQKLIDFAQKNSDRVIIVLGDSPTRLTTNNPLSFEIRKAMVMEQFPRVEIVHLPDYKYDDVWSKKLDDLIKLKTISSNEITLYGSRDSFIKCYTGIYNTHEVNVDGLSATLLRSLAHKKIENNENWRKGIIYASAHRYPVSFQTVDIAVLNEDQTKVLLGKKEFERGYRFIGGFVDVEDQSLEAAAKREVMEETGMIQTDDYKYLSSFRIDDWRYRKAKDKIMTAFFSCKNIFGTPKASDDIAKLEWFDINDLPTLMLEPEHVPMLVKLKATIKPIIPKEVLNAHKFIRDCETDLGFMGSPQYNLAKKIIEDYSKRQN